MSRPNEAKSYLLAAAVVLILLVSAIALTRIGADPDPPKQRSCPALSATQLHTIRANTRRRYAIQLNERFRRRDFAARAAALGADAATLEFSWKKSSFDQPHMQRLKASLHEQREVRKLGFRQAVVRVGQRVVWDQPLVDY